MPPEPINAGGSNRTDAAVLADPALPETVTPEQIYFNVPTELRRANTKVETAHLPKPTFTEPVIANKGTQIQFDICINDNGPAGTYTGSVLVGGPKNLQPVTLAVTVNKKDSTLFWAGIIVGSLIAFALLYLKEWKTIRDKYSKHTSRRGSRAWHALVRDLPTHAVIVISVVGAAAASYKIYTDNPAWGEDGAASWLALIGSMLAAIGGASLVTALRSGGPGADETPD